jgi:hypothetical protein
MDANGREFSGQNLMIHAFRGIYPRSSTIEYRSRTATYEPKFSRPFACIRGFDLEFICGIDFLCLIRVRLVRYSIGMA